MEVGLLRVWRASTVIISTSLPYGGNGGWVVVEGEAALGWAIRENSSLPPGGKRTDEQQRLLCKKKMLDSPVDWSRCISLLLFFSKRMYYKASTDVSQWYGLKGLDLLDRWLEVDVSGTDCPGLNTRCRVKKM